MNIIGAGTVKLYIKGKITINTGDGAPAIDVPSNTNLEIYSFDGTDSGGTLTASNTNGTGAGIGGGQGQHSGNITIKSGTIKATSTYGAGIGGGGGGDGGLGTVTITGGRVFASSTGGAGIGGGGRGLHGGDGTVTISGGTVRATSSAGAGIGGGGGDGDGGLGGDGTVTITGGRVFATSSGGAGIGGGDVGFRGNGGNGTVTINGGTVHATSSAGAGIGGGNGSNGGNGGNGNVTINGGTVFAASTDGAGIGGGSGGGDGDGGKQDVKISDAAVFAKVKNGDNHIPGLNSADCKTTNTINSGGTNTVTGVFFLGTAEGFVCGTPTLKESFSIPMQALKASDMSTVATSATSLGIASGKAIKLDVGGKITLDVNSHITDNSGTGGISCASAGDYTPVFSALEYYCKKRLTYAWLSAEPTATVDTPIDLSVNVTGLVRDRYPDLELTPSDSSGTLPCAQPSGTSPTCSGQWTPATTGATRFTLSIPEAGHSLYNEFYTVTGPALSLTATQPPSSGGGANSGNSGSSGGGGPSGGSSPNAPSTHSPTPGTDPVTGEPVQPLTKVPSERLGGADRAATALAVQAKAKVRDKVILVSPTVFADGVSAGALAAALGVGVLPATPAVLEKLPALGVKEVIIIGGLAAVAEPSLPGVKTSRLAGANRYETSAVIARFMLENGLADGKTVYTATGANFADALAASAAAARTKGLVLLVDSANASALGVIPAGAKVICVGGPACAVTPSPASKIVGADRYATAKLLLQATNQATGTKPTKLLLATGGNWPDALWAGPLADAGTGLLLRNPADAIPLVPAYVKQVIKIGGQTVNP